MDNTTLDYTKEELEDLAKNNFQEFFKLSINIYKKDIYFFNSTFIPLYKKYVPNDFSYKDELSKLNSKESSSIDIGNINSPLLNKNNTLKNDEVMQNQEKEYIKDKSIPLKKSKNIYIKIILTLLILVNFAIAGMIYEFFNREPKPIEPDKFEYKIEAIEDYKFLNGINDLGNDGWELVFARRASDGSTYNPKMSYEMIFKRKRR